MQKITYFCDMCGKKIGESLKYFMSIYTINPRPIMFYSRKEICQECVNKIGGN